MTEESTVLLAQFAVTRADIGSFRQLKTSTREKDYCTCLFEQQRQSKEVKEEEDHARVTSLGSDETTLQQIYFNHYYYNQCRSSCIGRDYNDLLDLYGFTATGIDLRRICIIS
ncbi:hypothetical protein BGX33_012313 [Mortierella sp. NVP41]|nr:hypothetical protein BGX33_012313 [Mortierella sp. NVP41]